MRVQRLSGRQRALVLPAAFYFLWLGSADWLNHFLTLAHSGSAPVAPNYIQFYLFHAAGIIIGAVVLRRNRRPAFLKAALAACVVLTCAFTALMAFSRGISFNIVCDAAGLFGGFLPALLSYYAFSGLPAKGRGCALGLSYGAGYLLHFILFVLAFPGQESAVLPVKAVLAVSAMLASGGLALFLPACRENLWADHETGVQTADTETAKRKPAVFSVLFILLFIFSVVYSSQSHAATAVWLNQGVAALSYARIFLVLGLFAGGVLCDRASKYFVLSLSFGLLAAGLLAILFGYMGILGFMFFSCAQFSAGLFSVFAWYMFIDTARHFKAPEIFSSLSLAFLIIFRQVGYLLMYAAVTWVDMQTVAYLLLIGNLILIAATIPLISRLFYVVGNLFIAGVQGGTIRPAPGGATESPMGALPPLRDFSDFRALYGLSERGMQVLSLTLEGFSNAEIAQNFGITERTVKYHTAQIFQKTNTKTHKQLFSLVIRSLQQQAENREAGHH